MDDYNLLTMRQSAWKGCVHFVMALARTGTELIGMLAHWRENPVRIDFPQSDGREGNSIQTFERSDRYG